MKYINKILTAGCLALGMGFAMTSCVNDLNVTPKDPNSFTWANVEADPDTYLPQVFAKCYSVLAVSGQSGDGSSDMSGLDNGAGCYPRAIYMLNEFPTDETLWIWPDAGVVDIVTGTWANNNVNIYGTYSRLYIAIALCNDFIRQTLESGIDLTPAVRTDYNNVEQYRLEARALRALSYWYVLDLFGNGGWVDETMDYGDSPLPITRKDLYNRLTTELEAIIAAWPAANAKPSYGRVGLDGVKALLAKVYLNAKVYTNGEVDGYEKCLNLCNQIIDAHKGSGFKSSGLANNYHALFAANNDQYMPGGSNSAENEILWGIPYDATNIQAYGGTRFLMAAAFVNATMADQKYYMSCLDYGLNDQWGCMHARAEFSDKFNSTDVRDDLWSKEAQGFTKENTEFSKFNNGYAPVKFTNLIMNPDGSFPKADNSKPIAVDNIAESAKVLNVNAHPDTDLPVFRLADIYLMKAECYVMGGKGNADEAIAAANVVRQRAGAEPWTSNITANDLLDERARELYWENHRRTDLVRFNKFTSGYTWSWKGYVAGGTDMGSHMNVYPIPANVIAAQPEFGAYQNAGY